MIASRPTALDLAREVIYERERLRLALTEMAGEDRENAQKLLDLGSDDIVDLALVAGLDTPDSDPERDRQRLSALAAWTRFAEGYLEALRAVLEAFDPVAC